MKSTFTLACLALLIIQSSISEAQESRHFTAETSTGIFPGARQPARMRQTAMPMPRFSTAKQTALASRLIGEYVGNGTSNATIVNYDSFSYSYSNGRGGDLEHPRLTDNYTFYYWDAANNSWHNSDRYLYSYWGYTETQEIYQQWDNVSWANVRRKGFTYGKLGQVITMVEDEWDYTTGTWKLAHKYLNQYNSDRLSASYARRWNTATSAYDISYGDSTT